MRAIVPLLVLAACGKSASSDGASTGAPGAAASEAPPVPAGAVRVSGNNFHVDAAPAAPCRVGAPCTVRLHLSALGDFHVNKDYPAKFVTAAPGLAPDGPGAFRTYGTHTGVLELQVRPAAAGTAAVRGTFKMSVCNDASCQIETPAISLDVPVS